MNIANYRKIRTKGKSGDSRKMGVKIMLFCTRGNGKRLTTTKEMYKTSRKEGM